MRDEVRSARRRPVRDLRSSPPASCRSPPMTSCCPMCCACVASQHGYPDVPISIAWDRLASPIRTDKRHLERVIGNFIRNAHVTPAGRSRSGRRSARPVWWRSGSIDAGPGVPARSPGPHLRALRPRRRRPPTTSGFGLGMSIAAEHARMLGGSIRVDDRPGGGARFVLLLPIVYGAGIEGAAMRRPPARWSARRGRARRRGLRDPVRQQPARRWRTCRSASSSRRSHGAGRRADAQRQHLHRQACTTSADAPRRGGRRPARRLATPQDQARVVLEALANGPQENLPMRTALRPSHADRRDVARIGWPRWSSAQSVLDVAAGQSSSFAIGQIVLSLDPRVADRRRPVHRRRPTGVRVRCRAQPDAERPGEGVGLPACCSRR